MRINIKNIDNIENEDFIQFFKYCYEKNKKGQLPDYLDDWKKYCKDNPKRIPETIRLLNDFFDVYKKKYEYDLVLVTACIMWIQKNVFITSQDKIKLSLSQKMIINIILGFWKGEKRIIEEATLIVGSGFGKSTLIAALNTLFLEVPEIFDITKIFIGANVHKQARIIFEKTSIMLKQTENKEEYNFINSSSIINKKNTPHNLEIISSKEDNADGIEPTLIIIDEIHARKDGGYINSLKKNRSKYPNMLSLEISTQGYVRGGYLDNQIEYARKVLRGDIKSDRELFIIFENESIDEIVEAHHTKEYDIYYKANPNLTFTQQTIEEFDIAIKKMIDQPSERPSTLTKRCNIAANKENFFYSANECKSIEFDESYMYNKVVFPGLDMARTRTPNSDLTALTFVAIDPNTDERRHLDYFFLPAKYRDNEQNEHDMIIEKSKVDEIDYQYFIDRGDVILVDDYEIKEDYIINFIQEKISEYNFQIIKFGLDPNKAENIKRTFNALTGDVKFCLDYLSERKKWNTPIIKTSQDLRSVNKVFTNNKLTEIHFANTMAKEDSNGYLLLLNPNRKRKDMAIAHMAAYSAYSVWSLQKDQFTGESNFDILKKAFYEEQ